MGANPKQAITIVSFNIASPWLDVQIVPNLKQTYKAGSSVL